MSSIWGIIDLDKKSINSEEVMQLRRSYEQFAIDTIFEEYGEGFYIACGIQYIVPEASKERLPIVDEDGNVFTADAILDNIEVLKTILGEKSDLPDGEVIYKLFRKNKDDALQKLLGSYAFTYYDINEEEVYLVADAVGNRALYYYIFENRIYFSTSMNSLIKIHKDKDIINRKYIANFLASDNLDVNISIDECPIKNVFIVPPGHYIHFKNGKIRKIQYWDPYRTIEILRLKTDSEYEEQFKKIYYQAVEDTLRTDEEVGSMLSGGLDSTSVACIAANKLKQINKKLYTFTYIPESDYLKEDSGFYVTNEKEYVENTVNFLGNLVPEFISLEGEHPITDVDQSLSDYGLSIKSHMNNFWFYKSMVAARKKNVRIMLTGNAGNFTVSRGNFIDHFATLLNSGRWFKLYKDLKSFQKHYKYRRSVLLMGVIKEVYSTKIRTWDKKSTYLSNEMDKKYKASKNTRKFWLSKMNQRNGYTTFRRSIYDVKFLRVNGEIDTITSLKTGAIYRDPTKDKRIIEFCMSLPFEQYSKEGELRRLLSSYLKDVMPNKLLRGDIRRGRQSADYEHRTHKVWAQLVDSWRKIYTENSSNEFVDCSRAINDLDKYDDFDEFINEFGVFAITRHIYTTEVLKYIKCINTKS